MKLLLEKYLYLLTEDPQMDAYEENYKKLKADILQFHKRHNPQKLTAEYANVPKEKIPKDVKKILDDYYKLVDEFSEAGKIKQSYSQYMRGEGPKPGAKSSTSSFWDDFFKGTRKEYDYDYKRNKYEYKGKTYDNFDDYRKAKNADFAKEHYTWKGKTYDNFDDYWKARDADFAKEHYTWKGKTYKNYKEYWKARDADFAKEHYTWKGKTYKNYKEYWKARDADRVVRRATNQAEKNIRNITNKVSHSKPSAIFAVASIAAVVLAISIIANRVKKKHIKYGMKKCSNLQGKNKEKCLTAYKIFGQKEKIKVLSKSLTKASQTSNPEQYKKEIQQEINKTQNRIIRLQQKL